MIRLMMCAMALGLLSVPSVQAVELKPMSYYNPVTSVTLRTSEPDGQPVLRVLFKHPVTRNFVETNVQIRADEKADILAFKARPDSNIVAGWSGQGPAKQDGDILKSRPAHKSWVLKPVAPLPAGDRISVKVLNTSPSTATDDVQDMTVYQFKTPKKGASSGLFRRLLDPTSGLAD